MTSRCVVIIAGALYDSPLWTNRQHIASRLAARGWKVLYVEPRWLLWRQLVGQFPGTRGRIRWLLRHIVPWRAAPNLWVLSQNNLMPWSRIWPIMGALNHRLWNAWHVRYWAKRLLGEAPVVLIYDTEAAEYLDDFPSARVVYDCVDDHAAQAGQNAILVAAEEARIVERAAAVAVTTELLREKFTRLCVPVHLVPNAADVASFSAPPSGEPSDIKPIPHPRIGTVGALDSYKVDVALLSVVATRHPEWHFVLVGPVNYSGTDASVVQLRKFSNMHFLGSKLAQEVPAYVHAFDVAMIPYRESSYNRSSFPLKFWEFMAAGKPVVASGLPSLAAYQHLASLPRTSEEFSVAIQHALAHGAVGRAARIAEAQKHDWSTRVSAIEQLLVTS